MAIDAGCLTSSLTLVEQEKIKTVLLSHHHFDHTRDLVTLCFTNANLWHNEIQVYALKETLDVIVPCLLDGKIYINLIKYPSAKKTYLRLNTIEPYKRETIAGYEVLPVPVQHSVPAVAYQITSSDGKNLFYTGDTGPGLSHCWQHVSPHLILTEVFAPNKFSDAVPSIGHLSPRWLKEELVQFKQLRGYLPPIVVIHIGIPYEQEIREEVAQVAEELGAEISLGYEGMKISL